MTTYHITLNTELAQIVEQKIKQEKFANKSEFFRSLIRKMFVQNNNDTITAISKDDADYAELSTMSKEKNATMPYSEFLKSLK